MKILIFGPGQCGSTRLFNLIRVAFDITNRSIEPFWIDDVTHFKGENNYLVKTHFIYNGFDNYDYKLLPIRDMRDSYISKTKKDPISAHSRVQQECEYFFKYKNESNLIVKYEDDESKIIKDVLGLLDINYDNEIINTIINRLEIIKNSNNAPIETTPEQIKIDTNINQGKKDFYKKTLFTKNHITGGGKIGKYKDYLDETQIKELFYDNEIINKFQEFNGYK